MMNKSVSADPFARQHRNWAQWFGPDWQAVRAATAARAQAAMEEWGLVDAEPFGSGGVGYVYRARLRTGEAVVLKVEPATNAWAPQGADRALVVWARAGLAPPSSPRVTTGGRCSSNLSLLARSSAPTRARSASRFLSSPTWPGGCERLAPPLPTDRSPPCPSTPRRTAGDGS